MAIAAGSGALFFHFDNFWGLVISGLIVVWAALRPAPGDGRRAGASRSASSSPSFLGALIALWPTFEDMSGRQGPAARAYVQRPHHASRIVPGLDLQGGLRLVYTVEVEEAIRDKRDQLRRRDAPGARDDRTSIHTGDGLVTRDGAREARREGPRLDARERASSASSSRTRPTRRRSTTASRRSSRSELAQQTGPGDDEVTFKIRAEVEIADPRARRQRRRRTPSTAASTSSASARRASRRATRTSSSRSRATTSAFDEIKEIIRKTARLEFKMVDDDGATSSARSTRRRAPRGRGHRDLHRERAGRLGHGRKQERSTPSSRASRQSKQVRERDDAARRCARFKKWAVDAQRPGRPRRSASRRSTTTTPTRGKSTETGWRTFYLFAPRRGHRRLHHRRARRAGPAERRARAYYVAHHVQPRRRRSLRGDHRRERQAPLRDHPRRRRSTRRRSSRRRSAAATRASRWARATRSSSSQNAREARARAPLGRAARRRSRRRTSRSSARRSARTRSQQGVQGRRSSASASCSSFMIFYYRKSRRRRRHRGALQPAPPARDPRVVQRDDDAAGHRRPRAHDRHGRRRQRAHQRAHPRGAARRQERARRGRRRATTRRSPSIIDGHVTVFISGLILAQYGTGPVKGFAVTLIIGIIAQPLHRRLLHAPRVRLVGARREGQAPQRRRGVLSHGVLQAGPQSTTSCGQRKFWIAAQHHRSSSSRRHPLLLPGPELRHRLPRRHRGRGRVQRSRSTARQVRKAVDDSGLLDAGRRAGRRRDEPEPLPRSACRRSAPSTDDDEGARSRRRSAHRRSEGALTTRRRARRTRAPPR